MESNFSINFTYIGNILGFTGIKHNFIKESFYENRDD